MIIWTLVSIFNFSLATWNQLDGVTFVSGDQSKVKGTPKKKSLFTKDRAAEFRKMALISSLPKWEGFHVEDETQEMTATEAIANLDNVVDSLSSVWMEEAGSYDRRKLTHFDARLVSGFIHLRLFGAGPLGLYKI